MAKHTPLAIVLFIARVHALKMNQSITADYAAHTCSEKVVRDVCACEKYAHGMSFSGVKIPNLFDAVGVAGAWLCNSCQDKFKWGFGCDVQCSEKCDFGCDFSGNCILPPKCLKNWRTKGDQFTNEHGECAACEDGYFGPSCQKVCPVNCQQTAEGTCTRGGKCYKCKKGYFGTDCSQQCPAACPSCVMEDKYVTDDKGNQLLLEAAGSCPGMCNGEFHGVSCNQTCSDNCLKIVPSLITRLGLGMIPSCYKQNGACRLCKKGWWGEKCEEKCSSACSGACDRNSGTCSAGCSVGSGKWGSQCNQECPSGCAKGRLLKLFEWVVIKKKQLIGYIKNVQGQGDNRRYSVVTDSGELEVSESELELSQAACDQDNGVCRDGCKSGFFGQSCDKKCPDNTDLKSGCDRETGTPKKCMDGFYVQDGECVACSETCKSGKCDAKGKCVDGCEAGFHGKMCELSCSSKCEGHCDAKTTGLKDGVCQSCEGGFTGKFCQEKCHPTCLTCASWAVLGSAATSRHACTSCRDHGYNAEPVVFEKNSIFGFFANSTRYGSCNCIENAFRPEGSAECVCEAPQDENFVERFELRPKKTCRHVCKEGLREVFGHLRSICIKNDVYKAVVRAELKGFEQGACDMGFYEVPVGSGKECVPEDYAYDIVNEQSARPAF